MTYDNKIISLRAQKLMFVPWYRLSDVMAVIKVIRKLNWDEHKESQQQIALDYLDNLDDTSPYSRHKRFLDDCYICEVEGNWTVQLQRLRSSIYKMCTPELEVHLRIQARYELDEAISKIMSNIGDGVGVYNQESFEEKFQIDWFD